MVDLWVQRKAAEAQGGHYVPKLWGGELWLENNDLYCGKLLYLKQGYVSSIHYHEVKDESFIALEGVVIVELHGWADFGREPNIDVDPVETIMLRGWAHDKIRIPPFRAHRFYVEEGRAVVLEVSTPHDDEDVVRLEDSRAI